jgi:hypothetical protein
MHARGHIDDKTMEYLTPEDPKPGRFCLLPKIHKENNPGRPIVSANWDSCLSAFCKYVVLSMTTTALPLSAGLIIISSLSCISLRADLSACVKLSVLGKCTSTLRLISDLIRSMTDKISGFIDFHLRPSLKTFHHTSKILPTT